MRLNCGKSREAQRQEARGYYCQWRRWFAWFPVRVGENDCRWLEPVERRASGVYCGLIMEDAPYGFTYRAIPEPEAA